MGHLLVLAGVCLFTVRLGKHYWQTLVKLFLQNMRDRKTIKINIRGGNDEFLKMAEKN